MAEVKLTVLGEDKSGPAQAGVQKTQAAIGALESIMRELASSVTALGENVAKGTATMERHFGEFKSGVAKEMKAAIDAAETEVNRLTSVGKATTDRLANHFEALGIRSTVAIEQERDRAVKAFDVIKKSGVTSAEEIARAEKALQQKQAELNQELEGKTVPATNRWAGALGAVKSVAAALGITISALALVHLAEDVALISARYNTLGVTMRVVGNNSGYTGAQMDEFEGKLRKTGIAAVESRQNLTTMAQAHIALAKSAELAREAQDAAVIGGINSSEAFSRMVYGIQSAQVEVLRTIGINVNFEDSYKKLGRQLGKSVEDLTEYEKVQARTNAVLAKGKDISGAYEAAMGTAGKQLNSLKRYTDDLKVVVGEVFNDALLIGVQSVTGGLKDLNDEAGQLRQKGQLQAWGKDAVQMMAFVADAVRYPIIMIRSIGDAIAATANLAISGDTIIARALTGDFAGAKAEWEVMKGAYVAYREDINKMWSAPSYQEQARKFYADRDANAAKDKTLAEEAERRRMAAAAAARKETEAKAAAEAAEKKYLENLKPSLENIRDYTAATKELGKERLDFAGQRFGDRLKQDVDLYKEGKRAAEDLKTAVRRYGVEANDVFNQRLADERRSLEKLGGLYDQLKQRISLSAQTKEAKAAGVDILKQYRETAQGIVSTEQDRYKTLLEGERAYANQVLGLIQAKKDEIRELQNRFVDANRAFEEAKRTALQGSYVQGDYRYLDSSLDPLEKRRALIDKLRREEAAALEISDPARRQAELQKVMDGWSGLTDAVSVSRTEMKRFFVEDGSWNGRIEEKLEAVTDTIVTQDEAYKEVSVNRKRIQDEMISGAEAEKDKLTSLYQTAIDKVETYKNKLVQLDDLLSRMSRTITIDLQVNGMDQIYRMQSAVAQATSSPYVSTVSGLNPSLQSWWNSTLESMNIPSYDVGTPYVPNDQLALVHKGERIVTAADNARGSFGSFVLQGDFNVVLQGYGATPNPKQLAREVFAEIEVLARRKRA